MIKRKFRPWVIPTIYSIVCISIIISLTLIGNTINANLEGPNLDTVPSIQKEDQPVNKEIVEKTNEHVIKPFTDESVEVDKYYYLSTDDKEKQQNSLISYQKIYMQNTGILYKSDKQFNIVAVLDGVVKNVKEDNILGLIIEVEHTNNITAYYQSVSEPTIKIGDKISQGDIIANSGKNNIDKSSENSFHFQVYEQGKIINPDNFYNMKLEED